MSGILHFLGWGLVLRAGFGGGPGFRIHVGLRFGIVGIWGVWVRGGSGRGIKVWTKIRPDFGFAVGALVALGSLGRYGFGMGVDVGVGIWPFARLCARGGVFASWMPVLGGGGLPLLRLLSSFHFISFHFKLFIQGKVYNNN